MLKQRIKAEGLMPVELDAAIASTLVSGQIMVDPFVTVTIAEYDSGPISVAGAVKQRLTFQAAGPVTPLEAITKAGGLAPEAGPGIWEKPGVFVEQDGYRAHRSYQSPCGQSNRAAAARSLCRMAAARWTAGDGSQAGETNRKTVGLAPGTRAACGSECGGTGAEFGH